MKRIISERFVTYAANEKWPSTARITIKMCDAIDQAMMLSRKLCIFAANSGNAGEDARHLCGRGRPRSQTNCCNNC